MMEVELYKVILATIENDELPVVAIELNYTVVLGRCFSKD